MWLLFMLACMGTIRNAYDLERTTVLRSPDPVQPGWEGQVRVRLSDSALSRIARRAVSRGVLHWKETITFDAPLAPKVSVIPSVQVSHLRVHLDPACAACLYLDVKMDGEGRVNAGPLSMSIPFHATLKATVSMQVLGVNDNWRVVGEIDSVEDIEIGLTPALSASIGPLQTWLSHALSQMPPFVLGEVGGANLPIRAARLGTDGRALELELVTAIADAVPVDAAQERLAEDWELRLHPDTLTAMLRYAGHKKGGGKFGIVDVPTALQVDGDNFTLDIRLWRLVGSGWWRDFQITGSAQIEGDDLKLIPEHSQSVAKSRNAGWVDPIFALAQQKTLQGVANGVRLTLPASTDAALGGVKMTPRLTVLSGGSTEVRIAGQID
jgi:hypothetical protein